LLAKVKSCAIYGLESFLTDVEIDISSGLPGFDIVGLPDTAVKESRERVKAAVKNQEFNFPIKRITVNLAPADIKKEGPHFDLPIALGILAATEQLTGDLLEGYIIAGELSLDGRVRPINGVLSMAIEARQNELKGIVIPWENSKEAALIDGIEVVGVKSLKEAVEFFKGNFKPQEIRYSLKDETEAEDLDFAEVKGEETLKRCIEIAAAGHHNIIMVGAPGSGKTMIARRMPSIMTPMTFQESLEITKIYSIAGMLPNHTGLIKKRPFRAPHHSISSVGMIGGGRIPKPGEVTLAHHGVLFLDEFPEFSRETLELLRQPLEDEQVTISRINATITYPAKFMLVAAMNPCPCGYYGDPFHECSCSPNRISKYLSRLSGPILDRIDIQVEAVPVKFTDFEGKGSTDSATIKKRVEAARLVQLERYKDEKIYSNSQLTPRLIKKYCKLGKTEKLLLKTAFENLKLSARAYNKILKVSRTIADLEASKDIKESHIAEALRYRNIDKYYHNLKF